MNWFRSIFKIVAGYVSDSSLILFIYISNFSFGFSRNVNLVQSPIQQPKENILFYGRLSSSVSPIFSLPSLQLKENVRLWAGTNRSAWTVVEKWESPTELVIGWCMYLFSLFSCKFDVYILLSLGYDCSVYLPWQREGMKERGS